MIASPAQELDGGRQLWQVLAELFALARKHETCIAFEASASPAESLQVVLPPYAAQVQQPIDADGSSVFNVSRGVVPVKFTLTYNGVATCQLAPATISLSRTAGTVVGAITEATYLQPSDSAKLPH